MNIFLKLGAAGVGVVLIGAGSVGLFLVKAFGRGGLFDQYQPDRVAELTCIALAVAGVALVTTGVAA